MEINNNQVQKNVIDQSYLNKEQSASSIEKKGVAAGNLEDNNLKINNYENKLPFISQDQTLPKINSPVVEISPSNIQQLETAISRIITNSNLKVISEKLFNLANEENTKLSQDIRNDLKDLSNSVVSIKNVDSKFTIETDANINKLAKLMSNEPFDSEAIEKLLNKIKEDIENAKSQSGIYNAENEMIGKLMALISGSSVGDTNLFGDMDALFSTDLLANSKLSEKELAAIGDKYRQALFGEKSIYKRGDSVSEAGNDEFSFTMNEETNAIQAFRRGSPTKLDLHETKILTDFFQMMAVFHELGVEMRKVHRVGRNLANEAVVEKIKEQAAKKRDTARNNMMAGMISGGTKIAAGGLSIGGAGLAAKADVKAMAQGRTDGLAGRLISMRVDGASNILQGSGEVGASQYRFLAGMDEAMEMTLRAEEEKIRFIKQSEQDQMEVARELTSKARDTFQQVFSAWIQSLQKTSGNI